MATAAYTLAQLEALRAAAASGARTVAYDGKSVTYHSLSEVLGLIDRIERELGIVNPNSRVRRTVASYRSGTGRTS